LVYIKEKYHLKNINHVYTQTMEELGIYIKERGRHQGIESIYVNIYIYIYKQFKRDCHMA